MLVTMLGQSADAGVEEAWLFYYECVSGGRYDFSNGETVIRQPWKRPCRKAANMRYARCDAPLVRRTVVSEDRKLQD